MSKLLKQLLSGVSYFEVNSSENQVAGVDFYKSHGELVGKEVCHG